MNYNFLFFVFCLFSFSFFSASSIAQWEQANGLYTGRIWCLTVKGTDLFAGGDNGKVFRSSDNGVTWQLANSGLPDAGINALISFGNNLFAGTSNFGVYISVDNGASWAEANSGVLPGYFVTSLVILGSNLFVGTTNGVFRSTDNGASWQNAAPLTEQFVRSLAANSSHLFAGTNGDVYVSTNNGDNWSATNCPSSNISALAVSNTNLFAASGQVYLSTDNGANWTQTSPLPNAVQSIIINGSNVFAGSYGGQIHLTTDNGQTWTDVSILVQSDIVTSLILNGSELFAGTASGLADRGGVFRSTDNGANWQASGLGLTTTDVRAFIQKDNNLFVGTQGGGVFRSTNNGISWYGVSIGITEPSPHIECFTIKDANLFVGIGGGIFLSTNDGNTWQERSDGLGLYYWVRALAVSGPSIFAAGNLASGIVFRSTDDGMNWIDVSSGQISGGIVSLAVIESNIFAVGNGVYVSTDNGAIWNLTGLADSGATSLAVIGTTIFTGSSSYGVFRSNNYGTNWVQVNSGLIDTLITSLTVSGANLFAGTFNGGVFVSTNYGDTWTHVSVGLPSDNIQTLGVNNDYLFSGFGSSGVWRNSKIIPVELTSFTASAINKNVELNWSTATETNNQGFEIERFQNYNIAGLQNWEKIGFVPGSGTTTEIRTYSSTDENLSAGKYSYRLKQIDFDGSFNYSNEIEVEIVENIPTVFSLKQNYPNPFNPSSTIRFDIPTGSYVVLKVYDILGKEVATLVNEELVPGSYETTFDGAGLSSGVYFYRINVSDPSTGSGQGFVQTKKLLLQK